MFTVDEPTAEAIRRAYDEGGELSGIVEYRRHFPLITDKAIRRAFNEGGELAGVVEFRRHFSLTGATSVRAPRLSRPPTYAAPAQSAVARGPLRSHSGGSPNKR